MSRSPSSLIATFLALYDDLARHLRRRTGSSESAEDAVQDTYLRLLETEARQQEQVRDGKAFIYRVAGNLAIDNARRERRLSGDGEPGDELPDPVAGPERRAIAHDRLQQIDVALRALPPNVRLALLLFQVDGLSHAQIAQRLGVSQSMVAKYLARGLRHLRDRVDDV